MTNVLLITAIIIGAGVIGTVAYTVIRVRRFSRKIFGTPDLIQGLQDQKDAYDAAPKNVSAMTKLELPRIEKDFPEFNWDQWKQLIENTLHSYLNALDRRDTSLAANVSAPLKEQLRREIEEAYNDEIEDSYSQIRIHDTQIARYEKAPGICRIKAESSVQYLHSRRENGKETLQERTESDIYITELIYIQDVNLVDEHTTVIGLNCPNCGAPVRALGERTCPFCKTALEPLNIRVWTLHRIEKMKTGMKRD